MRTVDSIGLGGDAPRVEIEPQFSPKVVDEIIGGVGDTSTGTEVDWYDHIDSTEPVLPESDKEPREPLPSIDDLRDNPGLVDMARWRAAQVIRATYGTPYVGLEFYVLELLRHDDDPTYWQT